MPDGFRMRRTDEELLSRLDDLVAAQVWAMWSTREAFLEQGAGFCLFRGEEMVSHCIPVVAGAGELEIGIGTEQPYRRRGFALLTASAFVEHCLARGLAPIWGELSGEGPLLCPGEEARVRG